jgi:hypothetical protein
MTTYQSNPRRSTLMLNPEDMLPDLRVQPGKVRRAHFLLQELLQFNRRRLQIVYSRISSCTFIEFEFHTPI